MKKRGHDQLQSESSKHGKVVIRFGKKKKTFKWRIINGVARLYAKPTAVERLIEENIGKSGFAGKIFNNLMLAAQLDRDPWPMVRMASVGKNSFQYLWDCIASHEEFKTLGGYIKFDDAVMQSNYGGTFQK